MCCGALDFGVLELVENRRAGLGSGKGTIDARAFVDIFERATPLEYFERKVRIGRWTRVRAYF